MTQLTSLWNRPEWPAFSWKSASLIEVLVQARHEQGRLLASPAEYIHSYELSEIRKHLLVDLIENATAPLTIERLHGWQASLFPTGYSGVKKILIADFRKKLLNRSSLPNENLSRELETLLHWWHEPPVELDPVVRSAISFLWFLLLSPYEDGNFQLACALAECGLQQYEKTKDRTYDLSLQLEENQEKVLDYVTSISTGDGDITEYLIYFTELFSSAVKSSQLLSEKNQISEKFWTLVSRFDLNRRQKKILELMQSENLRLTNRLYVELCKTSRESAKRDLSKLVRWGVLKLGDGRGRSVFYNLNALA